MAACTDQPTPAAACKRIPQFPKRAMSAKCPNPVAKPARCDNGVLQRGPPLTCHGRRQDHEKGGRL